MTSVNAPSPYTGTVPLEERRSIWHRLGRLQGAFPVLQLAIAVLVYIIGITTLPGFGSLQSLKTVLVIAALVGIAAIGQTFVVLIGGIDMSVAGFLVAGGLTVTQLASVYGLPFWAAVLILIPAAIILGGLVGWVCHRFRIDPLVVTLAMSSVALGIVTVQAKGIVSAGTPTWLSNLTSPTGTTFGIPVPPVIFIWAIVAVLLWLLLKRTTIGRRLYATGANSRAAGLSLIPTRWLWAGVFAFSALCASLGGILLAAFAGNIDPTVGQPYLFQSLAAVVIGGTVFGGPGDYTRTIVGTLMLVLINTVLVGHGFPTAASQILYGVAILVAVAIYGREKRLRDRV